MPSERVYKLVTVNTSPARATKLIGQVIEILEERYTVQHAANCQSLDDVAAVMRSVQPDIVFCASMWTPDERDQILHTVHELVPGVKTHALPQGYQVQYGPARVVEYVLDVLPRMLDEMSDSQAPNLSPPASNGLSEEHVP